MRSLKLFRPLLVLVFSCTALVSAQEKGQWRAVSTSARGVTGDIAFSGEKLIINFSAFTIAQIRELTPDEISAAFNADRDAIGSGNLYRLEIAGDKRFLHKNTLCGSEETQWLATYVKGRDLQVAFFSGSKMPALTVDAFANATNLCGTFTYTR
jgi:hypothetical protein